MSGPDQPRDADPEYEAFFRRWYMNGVRYARRRHRLQEWEAHAAASEALAELWVMWPEPSFPKEEDNRKRLYFRIVMCRSVDIIRSNVRHRKLAADAATGHVPASLAVSRGREPEVTDGEQLPEQAYAAAEALAEAADILTALPERQRRSVALEHDGYSARERAKIKGIQESNERVDLHRGRATMKKIRAEREQEGATE
ncbi:hypothetical protein [Streptomyces sp. NPDC050535]|uniref:hypothetical protein n=1 Tax=Streptomyces sp. NPDC050535 TaxID=3365626 RepID=UPI003792C7F2